MFAKLFKPRWKHNKATVRIRAVHRLSPGKTEHLEVLARLARQDQSVEVRLAAVEKIAAPELLSDILTHDLDPDIRRSAAKRICQIILDPTYTNSQQSEYLTYLHDENMLAHIALNSTNAEIQQKSIQRITDQHCLSSIAVNANSTQLRQAAAEKLHLPELLEQTGKAIKGRDKTVFRIIRTKQQQLQEKARQQEQILLRKEELLCSLEQLSRTDHFPLYGAKLEALSQQWSALEEINDTVLDDRYHSLVNCCQQTLSVEQLRCDQIEEKQQQAHVEEQQHLALLHTLEETLHRCATLIAGEHFCKADLDAEQACWNNNSQPLENSTESDINASLKPLLKRFNRYQQAGRQWLELNHKATTLVDIELLQEATQSTLQHHLKQIDQFSEQLNWPAEIKNPSLYQSVLQQRETIISRLNQLKREQQHCSNDLSELFDQLEQQIEAGQVKLACQLEQQAESQLNEMNGSTPKHLQQRHKVLLARLAELQNWQGFALAAKKEELCEAMEALTGSDSEIPALAKRINALQLQWKELDSDDPHHSHKTWQRFKTASDRAYEPCERYFREQKQQRTDNLKKRINLVAELNGFLEQVDWQQPDWALAEQISRTAKREWKEYAPVDRTPGRQVQTDFNALLKQLDSKISAHREQVANDKRALLQQALALADGENSPTTASEIKELQRRWKEAGNTFHGIERELWPEFRKACNQVFENLNRNKQAVKQQSAAIEQQQSSTESKASEALLRRISLCDQLEGLIDDGTLDQLALDEIQSVWEQCDPADEYFDPLINSRFELLLELISGRIEIEDLLAQTEKGLRQLCIRLEILLGQDSPEQDQTLRMEYQMDRLQKALEQRQTSTSSSDLKLLELEWQCQPFTLQHEALQIRFYSNLQQVS
ncbi:DUF349 domain-containing protein [uncultured Amphritea sp.]|uniref:DUF349 domain-containing protein n=1 Tax=uncultured Amphritea sp. TaxID=981605 RepID=UPI002602B6A9|nr:DUF349 domain-containing protein [uncultured Amphritea sp.]